MSYRIEKDVGPRQAPGRDAASADPVRQGRPELARFTGKLVDVRPDGRATYPTDGILRMRYRNGLDAPKPLEPERLYEITLDLAVTANVFLPGHRIRPEVSSSNFPRYDRNTNTGGVIAEEAMDQAVLASSRVLHGARYPSRLILPTVAR